MYEIHGAIKEVQLELLADCLQSVAVCADFVQQQEGMGNVTDMLGAVSTSDEACADPRSQRRKKKKASKGATAVWQPV